ncbi:Serine-threonine/tyrosine-protein kinase, catalytic domain [Sesbania bispinosa]|nr:Serine-threonine/tyrosine-protein kinase, catalytic domain [Sesbania bispinosa]
MARGYCLLPIPDTPKTNGTEMHHMETIVEHSNNHEAYQIVKTSGTNLYNMETTVEHSNNHEAYQVVKTSGTELYHMEHNNNHEAYQIDEQLKDYVCSVCENRRPKFELMKEFTYAELHEATNGFSPKNYLSEGGFGSVYKGMLKGLKIAVKQHKCASLQGEKEFKSEVNALSKALHENVVMLLGSCSEGNNRLLVYEFVCNGSLDQHLSEYSRKPLTWPDRIKLGDFGLARTEQMDSIYSTDVVGTLGYLAPEYAESEKCLSRDPQKRLSMDTVVSALSHIVEGSTCSIVLRHCSPARSDSSYDISESLESDVSMELEGEDGSMYVGYTPINLRPPPSPPIGSTSSCTFSMFKGLSESPSDDLANNEKKGERSNNQSG